ncbi:MAG: hypothetical protein QF511_12340 [Rhodospirillales bacterium]|nr:hypothetical protein [Rhodospirillales bacterium]
MSGWGKLTAAALALSGFLGWYDATRNQGRLFLCDVTALVGQSAAIPFCKEAPPDDRDILARLEYLRNIEREGRLSLEDRELLRRLETKFTDHVFKELTKLIGLEEAPIDAKAEADAREAVRETVEEGKAEERRALAMIFEGNLDVGLRLLSDLASAAAAENAAQWRRIGRIAFAVNTALALNAYGKVIALDQSDPWDSIYLGRLYRRSGALGEAWRTYEGALARLPKTEERDRSALLSEIGDVRVAQGDLSGALESYRALMAIGERLAKADPDNAGWRRDLSVSHIKIGGVQVAQGDLSGALKSYRASMAIAERLAKADPDNAGWQRDLSVSHDRIGDVQVAQGDLSGALESYRASMAIAERLAKADPDNAGWQADLAASHGKLGQLMSRMGERDKALELFRQGRALVAPLAERSGHALWKQYLATFDAEIAALGN